jgi:phytoene synthase
MNGDRSLIEELPPLQRLALAYAPASVRKPTLALLALDTRLAAILRAAREPMLAQLRLAWWREQLRTEPSAWPRGEPLLAALQSWAAAREALVALVDGWEAMTGAAPLPAAALEALATARGGAFAALAGLAGAGGDREAAARLGGNWALADLAAHLGDPQERRSARALAEARDWRRARLPRSMRPLVVLHGLAARALARGGREDERSLGALLAAVRLGLLGR